MSETDYCPHDLPRFGKIGTERTELWAKLLDCVGGTADAGASCADAVAE